MTVRKITDFLVLLAFISAPAASAQSWMTESGTAEFTSSVPLYSFTGTSEFLTGLINLADSTVDFYVDLSTLKTGIGKRDKDMRLSLNVKKYPFAEFYGKLFTRIDSASTVAQNVTVEGIFTLHGVKKSVRLPGTLQALGNQLILNAQWELNLEDYNIVPPKLLIVKVDKIQKIRISASLDPVKSP